MLLSRSTRSTTAHLHRHPHVAAARFYSSLPSSFSHRLTTHAASRAATLSCSLTRLSHAAAPGSFLPWPRPASPRFLTPQTLATAAAADAQTTATLSCQSPYFQAHIARIHQAAVALAQDKQNSTPSAAAASSSSPSSSSSASAPSSPSSRPSPRFSFKTLPYDLRNSVFGPASSEHGTWFRNAAKLIKLELSFVVTMSSAFGYLLAGSDAWSLVHVLANFLGTSLCATSAAICNQMMEIPYDAQMSRTKDRPLVTGFFTKQQAATAATLCALAGAPLLHFAAAGDWVAPTLGLGTIAAYALIYTPLKRYHRWNTEVGALVGSVPVLIGWSCAVAHWSHHMAIYHQVHLPFTTMMSLTMPHALYGYLLLSAWQMQHFMAIAYSALNKGLAWTGILCIMPFGAWYFGVTSFMFCYTATAINAMLVYKYGKWKLAAMALNKANASSSSSSSSSASSLALCKSTARSAQLAGIIYFFLMFGAVIFHSLDNKYHLIRNFVPIDIREIGIQLCPHFTKEEKQSFWNRAYGAVEDESLRDANLKPCTHVHERNDSKCIYMRMVKQETLDRFEPKTDQHVHSHELQQPISTQQAQESSSHDHNHEQQQQHKH